MEPTERDKELSKKLIGYCTTHDISSREGFNRAVIDLATITRSKMDADSAELARLRAENKRLKETSRIIFPSWISFCRGK